MWLCADHMILLITNLVFFESGVGLVFSYCALPRHRIFTKVTRISITFKIYCVEPMACNGVYLVLYIGLA